MVGHMPCTDAGTYFNDASSSAHNLARDSHKCQTNWRASVSHPQRAKASSRNSSNCHFHARCLLSGRERHFLVIPSIGQGIVCSVCRPCWLLRYHTLCFLWGICIGDILMIIVVCTPFTRS